MKLVKDIKLHLFIEQHQCNIISKFCVSISVFKMDVVKPNTPSEFYNLLDHYIKELLFMYHYDIPGLWLCNYCGAKWFQFPGDQLPPVFSTLIG